MQRSRLMDLAQDILIVLDASGVVIDVNQAAADMHGGNVDDIIGRNCAEFLAPSSGEEMMTTAIKMYQSNVDCSDQMRVRAVRWDGHVVDLELRVSWSVAERRFYVVERDVSTQVARTRELQELSEELAIQAMTDTLTGIGNRAAFEQALNFVEARDERAWLVMVDIDHFKTINDRNGHLLGDAVLTRVASRLGDAVRGDDFVSRVGGDEFTLILRAAERVEVHKRLDQIHESLTAPYLIDGATFAVSCSLGAAQRKNRESNEDWLRRADRAMYSAKDAGRSRLKVA